MIDFLLTICIIETMLLIIIIPITRKFYIAKKVIYEMYVEQLKLNNENEAEEMADFLDD